VTAIALLGLGACERKPQAPSTQKVVYLINGALGDNAFYDSGKTGIDALVARYGVETRTIECNFDAAKYQPSLEAAVGYADVIFVISYAFEDQLKEIADKNPGKIFVNLDTVVRNSKGTITSVDYVEEESAYLVGVAAALATTDGTIPGMNPQKIIGAVTGDVDPVIESFLFAFRNGARSVHPDIVLETRSLGGAWDDQAKGKQAALQLYDLEADVVFQIAAAAGLGVLQAARERGLYAIGVDTNQNDIEPGHVIASDIKDVGKSIQEVFATIRGGTYTPGKVLEYGIAAGGVDIALEATVPVLPAATANRLAEIRQSIIDGSLVVERYRP
jgi:basic membrane protein A